ncbi:MAG: hypothetical protein ACE5HZ_06335 [Fidelibacterota bacterium]
MPDRTRSNPVTDRLERFVYDRVKSRPRLKRVLTDTYQRVLSVVPQHPMVTDRPVTVREGFFFGFHDKCPWSSDNRFLLAHRVNHPLRMPVSDDEIDVGLFHGEDYREFKVLGKTRTWNWQTGSMLQWMESDNSIAFNDLNGETHVARVVDAGGQGVRHLPRPMASVSPDGTRALSHSFARLRKVAPAYGYANGSTPEEDDPLPREDGLFIMDTETGESERLFTVRHIATVEPESSMESAYHYFSHCLFSPSGTRFTFFHRWVTPKGMTVTRMISSDIGGNDLFVFPTDGKVTHVAWRDDETILAYASTRSLGDHYYLFTDKKEEFSVFGGKHLTSDGHPQFSPDGSRIVTDTYPNGWRHQYLIVYDAERDRRTDLVKVHSPFRFRHDLRCDLHPRWDRTGGQVCFDSAHTGTRSLCTVHL